jgi:hypothetical protein
MVGVDFGQSGLRNRNDVISPFDLEVNYMLCSTSSVEILSHLSFFHVYIHFTPATHITYAS